MYISILQSCYTWVLDFNWYYSGYIWWRNFNYKKWSTRGTCTIMNNVLKTCTCTCTCILILRHLNEIRCFQSQTHSNIPYFVMHTLTYKYISLYNTSTYIHTPIHTLNAHTHTQCPHTHAHTHTHTHSLTHSLNMAHHWLKIWHCIVLSLGQIIILSLTALTLC